MGGARFDADLTRVAFFEKELAKDGALFVKCWFHLSKDAQKKRLKKFEKDPETRFKVTRLDWKHFGRYDRFVGVAERAIRTTDTPEAPWTIVEAADDRWRDLAVGRALVEALRDAPRAVAAADAKRAAERKAAEKSAASAPKKRARRRRAREGRVRSRRSSPRSTSGGPSPRRSTGRSSPASRSGSRSSRGRAKKKGVSSVAVFEGSDAAGKGGSDQARDVGARRAPLPRHPDRRPDRRGARAPLPLAVLAAHAPGGQLHHLRPLLVRARPRREGRGVREGGGVEAGLPRDQRLRGTARRVGDRPLQALAPHLARGAAAALPRARQVEWKKHKITDEDWRNREKWDAYETPSTRWSRGPARPTRRGPSCRATTRSTPA
jgi:AMP-polyphosphate phosphotransferase